MTRVEPSAPWRVGEKYEPFVGRWSRLVAREFVKLLDVPPGKDWLDVGCGTGALTRAVLDGAEPKSVRSIEPSAGFLEYAKGSITDPRVRFDQGDAQSLPVDSGSIDATVSGLVLNFIPDQARGVAEMARATRPGGLVAGYVWDYAGKMELLRYFWDAVVTLDRDTSAIDEGNRFPICRPEPLNELFTQAGLRDVDVRPIDIPTPFRDFDDYWTPFLGGQGPAPSYSVSLDYERQSILRDFIRGRLPIAKDGSIHLIARAWAVRGRVAP